MEAVAIFLGYMCLISFGIGMCVFLFIAIVGGVISILMEEFPAGVAFFMTRSAERSMLQYLKTIHE
jgi:hypothetical protein